MSNIYNEASREEVITIMKELRFTGMLESYDEVIDGPRVGNVRKWQSCSIVLDLPQFLLK